MVSDTLRGEAECRTVCLADHNLGLKKKKKSGEWGGNLYITALPKKFH